MDKAGFDNFDFRRVNPQNFSRLNGVFSDNANNVENEPELGFRNTLNREMINAAKRLETTGKTSRNEAGALMGQSSLSLALQGVIGSSSNEASALTNQAFTPKDIAAVLAGGRFEAGALMGQALARGGGPVSPDNDFDSLIRFDFVKQVSSVIESARERIAKSGRVREIEQLESDIEDMLALEPFSYPQNSQNVI